VYEGLGNAVLGTSEILFYCHTLSDMLQYLRSD